MTNFIPYAFWASFFGWVACFLYIKIHLQAHNLDKDYMLRRHFSIWSEFPEIIRTEENGRRRRRFRIVYRCHNIAGVLLLIFLLLYLVIERF